MNKIISFIRNLAKNPKTSAAGITSICTGIAMIVASPASLTTGGPEVAILTGLGLLFAVDQNLK